MASPWSTYLFCFVCVRVCASARLRVFVCACVWVSVRVCFHPFPRSSQARLGPVKGKNFRKEMTKAKRGTYQGGAMDVNAVNSVKFNYEDD